MRDWLRRRAAQRDRMEKAPAGEYQLLATGQVVKDPDYVAYSYDQYGNASVSSSVMDNANKERRQVSSEQKAQTYREALAILNEIVEATPKVRAEMVSKFNVEF